VSPRFEAGYTTASAVFAFIERNPLQSGGGSLIAAQWSTYFFLRVCRCPGVTVLSAVGMSRRNVWSEAQALQCPQRAGVRARCPGPSLAVACTLAPGATGTSTRSSRTCLIISSSRGCRCCDGPAERHARAPDAVQDNRELPGQCHARLTGTRSPGDHECPVLQA
jgi:hypothetical protein